MANCCATSTEAFHGTNTKKNQMFVQDDPVALHTSNIVQEKIVNLRLDVLD